jgi:hypothetical protein
MGLQILPLYGPLLQNFCQGDVSKTEVKMPSFSVLSHPLGYLDCCHMQMNYYIFVPGACQECHLIHHYMPCDMSVRLLGTGFKARN